MSKTTPTFICTLELEPTYMDVKALENRFKAVNYVYNQTLGYLLKKVVLLKHSRAYKAACKMPVGDPKGSKIERSQRKARNEAFQAAQTSVGLSLDYSWQQGWAKQFQGKLLEVKQEAEVVNCTKKYRKEVRRGTWVNHHLQTASVAAVVAHAVKVVASHLFEHRGRPKFRSLRDCKSIPPVTSKNTAKDGTKKPKIVLWRVDHIKFNGLSIPVKVDMTNPKVRHALSCPIKYLTIKRKTIRGKLRYYVDLACEGYPHQKEFTTTGLIGDDLGVGSYHVWDGKTKYRFVLPDRLKDTKAKLRRLQRKECRQRLANTDKYNKRGKCKSKSSADSNAHRQNRRKITELYRREAEHTKNIHGQIVNKTRALGDHLSTEDTSTKEWKKNHSKRMQFSAPGALQARMKKAFPKVTLINTYKTCLSQLCPNCGSKKKKTLSQRQHKCECGAKAHRDDTSAYLARTVQDGKVNMAKSKEGFEAFCSAPVVQLTLS